MTTRFRLDAVTLATTDGEVRYEYPSDLTVLAGPTGVGKTTLLELIKYGFGGDAVLAPVARQHVNDVTIDATQPSLNTLLLTALGLPDDMRAAARTGASRNAGARITFADVFSFLYVAQSEINRDIAHSQDSYREPKRKTVFELLFGLTNARILAMRSDLNRLNDEIAIAEKEHETVLTFLADSHTTGRQEAQQAISATIAVQLAAEAEQATLRDAIEPVTDRETHALRDLLTEAERGLADARAAVTDLIRDQAEYASERRRVQSDLARLRRMRDAGERLASIEFAVCPRCLQSLTDRDVPHGSCRVCLQADPVQAAADGATDQYEARQLADQLAEMDDQLHSIAQQLTATIQAVTDRELLVKSLTAEIDTRTAERITPRLQAFSDAAERLAAARAERKQLEVTLRQWDRADDLGTVAERLRADRERIRTAITTDQSNLDTRRLEIIGSLTEEFQDTVTTLGIPGVETASIHPATYLPLLNGQPFATFSLAGGILTATQIAYWISLLTVALRRGDTYYPAFLLIDSPRLALNTAEALSAALYQRLVTQADADPGRLQLIIADNELPTDYRRHYAEIDFTYQAPTVSTVQHPGPAGVRTIGDIAKDNGA